MIKLPPPPHYEPLQILNLMKLNKGLEYDLTTKQNDLRSALINIEGAVQCIHKHVQNSVRCIINDKAKRLHLHTQNVNTKHNDNNARITKAEEVNSLFKVHKTEYTSRATI